MSAQSNRSLRSASRMAHRRAQLFRGERNSTICSVQTETGKPAASCLQRDSRAASTARALHPELFLQQRPATARWFPMLERAMDTIAGKSHRMRLHPLGEGVQEALCFPESGQSESVASVT